MPTQLDEKRLREKTTLNEIRVRLKEIACVGRYLKHRYNKETLQGYKAGSSYLFSDADVNYEINKLYVAIPKRQIRRAKRYVIRESLSRVEQIALHSDFYLQILLKLSADQPVFTSHYYTRSIVTSPMYHGTITFVSP